MNNKKNIIPRENDYEIKNIFIWLIFSVSIVINMI